MSPPLLLITLLALASLGACATARETGKGGDAGPDDGPRKKDRAVPAMDWPQRKDAASPDQRPGPDLKPKPDTRPKPDTQPPPKPCPDLFESNNNCSSSRDLGSVTEGTAWVTRSATLNPAGDVDWYLAEGKEKSHTCIPLTPQTFYFRAKVMVPAGRQVKACLYLKSCAGTSACKTAGAGSLELKLKVSGTCAVSDDTKAHILVQAVDSKHDCQPYSVGFNFNDQ